MKIGLNLDNRGPGATPENMIRFATTADQLGFSSLAVSDHIVLVNQQTEQAIPTSPTGIARRHSRKQRISSAR